MLDEKIWMERDASKYIKVLFIHADHIEFTMWWLKN